MAGTAGTAETADNTQEIHIIEKLIHTHKQLWYSVIKEYKNHPDTVKRLQLIHQQIEKITDSMEELIDDINRERFDLTEEEQVEINNKEISEKVLDRLKPAILMSIMYENGLFESNQTPEWISSLDYLRLNKPE